VKSGKSLNNRAFVDLCRVGAAPCQPSPFGCNPHKGNRLVSGSIPAFCSYTPGTVAGDLGNDVAVVDFDDDVEVDFDVAVEFDFDVPFAFDDDVSFFIDEASFLIDEVSFLIEEDSCLIEEDSFLIEEDSFLIFREIFFPAIFFSNGFLTETVWLAFNGAFEEREFAAVEESLFEVNCSSDLKETRVGFDAFVSGSAVPVFNSWCIGNGDIVVIDLRRADLLGAGVSTCAIGLLFDFDCFGLSDMMNVDTRPKMELFGVWINGNCKEIHKDMDQSFGPNSMFYDTVRLVD